MRIDVDKYHSTFGIKHVTLALAASTIATFTKMTENARISIDKCSFKYERFPLVAVHDINSLHVLIE